MFLVTLELATVVYQELCAACISKRLICYCDLDHVSFFSDRTTHVT